MNQLLDRVRQFWPSRHPRTWALAVLAPFIAQYHAMTGQAIWRRLHYLDSGGRP